MDELSDDGRTDEEEGLVVRRSAAWSMDGFVREDVHLAYLRLARGATPQEAIAQSLMLTGCRYGDLLQPEELGPLSVSQATALALSRYRSWVATLGIGELPSDPLETENE